MVKMNGATMSKGKKRKLVGTYNWVVTVRRIDRPQIDYFYFAQRWREL